MTKKTTKKHNLKKFYKSSNKNSVELADFSIQTAESSVNAADSSLTAAALDEESLSVEEQSVNHNDNSKANLVNSDNLPVGFVRKSNRKLKPTKANRPYLTCPDGKRRWVRITPPGVRGPDKKLRKHGPDHALYVHGFGKSREYDPKKYTSWKEGVLRAGGFRCLVTGKTKDLTCHHLNSWDWFVEGRYDIANGVVLTDEIHKQFHSLYGSGQNTRKQFTNFLLTYYNMTLNNEQHGNHEPSLTVESLQKELEQKAVEKNADFIKLLESRNHGLVSGVYQNIDSRIVVICRIHDVTHETTVRNYKKARTGMPCCGKARQSAATTYHNTLR